MVLRILLGALSWLSLQAADIPLTVVLTSPTQGVVSFTNAGLSGCSYSASALLFGATRLFDTSALTVLPVGTASFVHFGTGSAEAVLPAGTSISVGISCNSGAHSGTTTFTTKPLPTGDTSTVPPPFNSYRFGNWNWPLIDFADSTKTYVDPMRGTVLKRVTSPGWFGRMRPPETLDDWGGGSGWTNAGNAVNGSNCDGGTAHCAQTSNSNKVFLAFPFKTDGGRFFTAGFESNATLDDFILLLKGVGSNSSAINRQVNICLTYFDSGTCDSAVHTATLPASLGPAGFPASTLGAWTATAAFNFAEWGGTVPERGDFSRSYGTVTVTAGTNVTLTSTSNSYNYFNTKWRSGALIYIAGSGCSGAGSTDLCKIALVKDPQHLTLESASANVTNAAYRSAAAGALVWKTTGTGSVTFGATYSIAYSGILTTLSEGNQQVCSPNALTVDYAADGVTRISPAPGYLCRLGFQDPSGFSINGVLFLLIPSTGETRLLSPLYNSTVVNPTAPAADQNVNAIMVPDSPWDSSVATDFYGYGPVAGGKTGIFRIRYNTAAHFKAYSHSLYPCGDCYLGGPVNPGQDPAMAYPGGRWADDPLTYTNITPASAGKDVTSQIAAHNPTYDPAVFTAMGAVAVLDGHMIFNANGGVQDSIAVYSVFDLATGLHSGYGDSYSTYPMRWCGQHSNLSSRASGYFGIVCNPPGGASGFSASNSVTGQGPHQTKPYSVWKGGAFSTDTSLSATFDNCANYSFPQWIVGLGATGTQCFKLRTQDVCSHTPTAQEAAKWPCPSHAGWSQIQGLAAGDELGISDFAGRQEFLLVGSVTPVTDAGCGTNCVEIAGVRDWKPTGQTTWPSGWSGIAVPPSVLCNLGSCTPGIGAWVKASAANMNTTWLSDPSVFASHVDVGAAPGSGNATTVQGSLFNFPYKSRYNQTLAAQAGSFATAHSISSNGPFRGLAPSSQYQSYPSNEQINAPSAEKKWFLDFHSMNGPLGYSSTESKATIAPQGYNLVGGTSGVYRFTSPAGGIPATVANYKIRPPVVYAGRWLLKDISGPATGNIVTDATPWTYCFVAKTNECRSGSTAGEIYASVPNVPAVDGNCYTTWMTENIPCAMFPATSAAQLVQMDGSRAYNNFEYGRILTMGLTGYGRQYQFSTFIPETTGRWGLYKADWLDGLRSEVMMVSIPSWNEDGISRNDFQSLPVTVPASTYAEVRFGYAEYGAPDQHRCTWRQEPCHTSAPAGIPFNFESEARTLRSCASGCTIDVPVLPDRIVYYRWRTSNDGVTWTDGPMKVGAVAAPTTPSCADLTFSPGTHFSPVGGDSGAFNVTVTDQSCAWTAEPSANWLNITAGGTGVGNGTLNWSVSPNSGAARIATISSAGAWFTVTQADSPLPAVSGTTIGGGISLRGVSIR